MKNYKDKKEELWQAPVVVLDFLSALHYDMQGGIKKHQQPIITRHVDLSQLETQSHFTYNGTKIRRFDL